MKSTFPILLTFPLLLSTLAAQPTDASLERILSAPFSSDLTASPAGDAVAWTVNVKGVRNLWAAQAPDWRGKKLTAHAEDDGRELRWLAWTHDARRLLYVRGSQPNSRGEFPNPTHDPQGGEEAIWTVDFSGSEPRRLTDGYAPVPIPSGDGFVYLNRGQIWRMGYAPDDKPVQLLKTRGSASRPLFSPGGDQFAFSSGRGDHGFVAVYDLKSATLRYLDPSVDTDFSPTWSPDGRRVAFVRTPADDPLLFTPQRTGQPWSIRVVDLETGTAREVWRAEPGPGSVFHGLAGDAQLFWTAGDRLVFPWEKDGWTHLYSVAVQGGAARPLTPGDFEVEEATATPEGKTLYFTSNQEDIDRRHVWTLELPGNVMRRATGAGIQWSPTPLEGGALAYLGSDAKRPATPYLLAEGAVRRLEAGSPAGEFAGDSLVEPEQVVFPSADGLAIHGQLFLPPVGEPGQKRPAVLFFHGGSRRQMLLGWHYLDYYHQCYALNQYLASRGFVVLSVNYRSGIGYGLDFREAVDYGAAGASEYNDVTGAALYLKSRPDVDGARIGLWGGSYGGYLTALGLARSSGLFAAGVDIHGVHDWNKVIANFNPDYNPLERPEEARLAFQSSPMASIASWRSPVLLIHGDDDRNVPFGESVDLAKALRRQGVEFEQLVLADEVHDFLTHRSWMKAFAAAADFLERKLMARR